MARESIVAATAGQPFDVPREPDADVQGAFVTLRQRADGELRGCIGTLQPVPGGLPHMVAETARSAALRDPRFPPVEEAEVPGLRLEVSILGPLQPIDPAAVEVGVHGLVLRARGRSGLLLPQVPAEHGWDRTTFLEAMCRKAGLPAGAWREPGAELLSFTAEVFGED